MKTTITREEYLQLVGLLALAERHNAVLKDIEAAACALLGVVPDPSGYAGHVSDAINGHPSFGTDSLLARLGVSAPEGLPRA